MSKKLLVPYSIEDKCPKGSGFVVPVGGRCGPKFISLPSLKEEEFGMVVYSGKEVKSEFIFSRIVDCGVKISPSVTWQMQSINRFLQTISRYKIGCILKLEYARPDNMILTKINIKGTKL